MSLIRAPKVTEIGTYKLEYRGEFNPLINKTISITVTVPEPPPPTPMNLDLLVKLPKDFKLQADKKI